MLGVQSVAEMVRAAAGFQWAMTVFGARQMVGALTSGDDNAARQTAANLYRIATKAQEEFNGDSSFFATFAVGDLAQSSLMDLAEKTLTLKVLEPGFLQNMATLMTRSVGDAAQSLDTSTARRLTLERIRNTFKVVDLVNQFEAPSVLSAEGTYPLAEMVDKAYALGDYPALWAVEGLGKNYAFAYMKTGQPVTGLMMSKDAEILPAKSLLMMHAGQGMCFAKTILGPLTPFSTDSETDRALERFLQLCRDNSRPGYFGPTAESLGLCCRTWYSHLQPQVSRRLAVLDHVASQYFWHGAGRSMYFSPLNMFPGSPPWFAAESEPPDDISRRNARAGAAWAFTVVNCQSPEVVAHFLTHKADQIAGNDAFREGVFSTLIMAGDMYPGHKYIPEFCNYQPDASLENAWHECFGAGFLNKVNHYRKVLRANDKLGEVFRYQPLSTLIPSLEGGARD